MSARDGGPDWQTLMAELADDLEAQVRHEYGADHPDGVHKAQRRRYERDMDPVRRAREMLAARAPGTGEDEA